MNENRSLLTKWLQYLMYLHIASLILSAVNAVTSWDAVTRFVGLAISVGAALCLFQLRSANARYQKSAVFRAVMLGCTLAVTFLSGPALLTYVASICSFIAGYQEYHGHGEVVGETDSRLSQRWNNLFLWSLAMGMVSGFASVAIIMIGAVAEMEVALISGIAVWAVLLADAVIEILYLRNMKHTLRLLETQAS